MRHWHTLTLTFIFGFGIWDLGFGKFIEVQFSMSFRGIPARGEYWKECRGNLPAIVRLFNSCPVGLTQTSGIVLGRLPQVLLHCIP